MLAKYSKNDIILSLKNVGLVKGDKIFIHSNLGFFGILDGARSKDEMCQIFVNSIYDVIGNEGTLVVPTFSYSYCHNEIYNPKETGTTCGMLSEFIMNKFPNNRSLDPNFSICAIGKDANTFINCNIHESFGRDCFWERFYKLNGKIVCMNFDAGSTFIHYIERTSNVAYRWNKSFNGVTKIDGKLYKDYAVHFVFEGEDDAPCMERVDSLCRINNLVTESTLGNGIILCFEVKEYFDFFSSLLKERPRVLCRKEY